uniref:Transposase IS116/IS110/IS902 family protein n=2 Tax=Mycolicibacterium TaxID=1866885 RepID=A0A1S6GKW7_9MYCO|nr:Transposase IS116/IS110/IS902 family protein [Mycolicibacterium sp. CBMA 213]
MPGCGYLSAARLVAEAANVTRFRTEAQFAMHVGLAPIPHYSANQPRFRAGHSGHRAMRSAIHKVAVAQIRSSGVGRPYYDRRLESGDNKPAALRALRRKISRKLFSALRTDYLVRTAAAASSSIRRALTGPGPVPPTAATRRSGDGRRVRQIRTPVIRVAAVRPRLLQGGRCVACKTSCMSNATGEKPTATGEQVPFWTGWSRNQRIAYVAFVAFLITVVMPVVFMAGHDPTKLIQQGDAVDPGWGRNVVYVNNEDPKIRCTATTSSGETLNLAPFEGANRRKALGQSRYATSFWAVGELPTDRGTLHISCPSADLSLWIAAPDDNTWLYVFLCLIGTMTVTTPVVAIALRRRQRAMESDRRDGQP